jgi:hypothetical protein
MSKPQTYTCNCGGVLDILASYPDTGTSVDLYESQCRECGASGTLAVENQDDSYSFTVSDDE